MARQRKLSPERKAFINSIIQYYHPEDASAEMVSHMTDRILPVAKEWQTCPLRHMSDDFIKLGHIVFSEIKSVTG